jgi:hypothetical protein
MSQTINPADKNANILSVIKILDLKLDNHKACLWLDRAGEFKLRDISFIITSFFHRHFGWV